MRQPPRRTHSGAMNASVPLHRATTGRMAAGVAAGLASYMNVDVTLVRIGFVLATVVAGGLGIVAYLACLLLVPEEGATESIATSLIREFQGGR
jgi:phage shock protein PspC (stress-responsive transcriptional regulator)